MQAVEAARNAVRKALASAVADEAFSEVSTLARTAEALAVIARELAQGVLPLDDQGRDSSQPDMPTASGQHASVRVPLARNVSYPQFLRDGDRLVKRAWSKKERAPYEHKAPREVVQALVESIRKRKGEGKLFQAADVMPLTNAKHEDYPSYQSYLALFWLREIGLIRRKGREGYVLRPKTATTERLSQAWDALPILPTVE